MRVDRKDRRPGLGRDSNGSVQLEFIIVTLFASLVIALGLQLLGPGIVATYGGRRAVLYSSTP